MNNEIKWVVIGNCCMWIASSVAILGIVYITKESTCLWALLIPALSGYSYKNK